MIRSLMEHQCKILEWSKNRKSIALFVEMRLGKTITSIRYIYQQYPYLHHPRILVVAPLAVLPTWQKELEMEGLDSSLIHPLQEITSKTARLPYIKQNYGWFLANYEALRSTPETSYQPWDAIILDESTRIKNPKAQITKLLLERYSSIPVKVILSGLPNPESSMDYYTQMRFLFSNFMGCGTFWQFRHKHCYQDRSGFGWHLYPNSVKLLKQSIENQAYTLSRKQVNLGSKKIYETRYVELTPLQKKLYKEAEKDFAIGSLSTKYTPVKFNWMAQIAGGFHPDGTLLSNAKNVELLSLLKGELKGEPVVVWYHFNRELGASHQFMNQNGIISLCITGETPLSIRQKHIASFKTGKTQVLLVQIKCGKFGVDWSNSSTAIYYSNSYSMEDRAQSEDRIVHPLKKEPLLYIDLVTKDTIDEDAVKALQDKKADAKTFLNRIVETWRLKSKVVKQ